MVKIAVPVWPFRGFRSVDSWGSGNFGAVRDKGTRPHNGLDLIARVGDEARAPIDGVVTHVGVAYGDSTLGSLHIAGRGLFAGWEVKMLYLEPTKGIMGRGVDAGAPVGVIQDVAGYWHAKQPGRTPGMRNHLHIEIWVTEPRAVDPSQFLPSDLMVSAEDWRA